MEYQNFIKTGNKELIDKWLAELDLAYAQGNEAVSDQFYDSLIKIYEERFGKRLIVGAPVTKNPVALPIAMMSLDKVMTEKEMHNFMKKNPGPYVVEDKINGNSALYEIKIVGGKPDTKLYNRGDGTTGTDLTYLLQYLKLPVLPFSVYIKGELVVDKKDYEPYKQDYKTNLSMINGLVNSLSADPDRLKLIRFIAYDMAFPDNPEITLNSSKTLEYLSKYGFTVPFNVVTPGLTIEWLSALFKQQKQNQAYDVDGLVIISDRNIKYEEKLIRENPKYSVAFKEYEEGHEATVTEVVWEASKHGVIKPVVKVKPVPMPNGVTIRSLTAFNAKWIADNKIGPDSIILVTHNTIPYILDVVKSTEAQLPPANLYPEGSWKWNDTRVDIVLLEANDEVKIARLYEFFHQIGCKYWGETTLAKFYYAGFDTIKIMLEASKEQLLNAKIEGIGEGIIDRMIKSRDEALPNVTLPILMSASGAFGLGFGVRKISVVLAMYPNILNQEVDATQIKEIEGFADKTAEKFIEGLPKFKEFIDGIPILQQVIKGQLKPVSPKVVSAAVQLNIAKQGNGGQSFKGKSAVFTGFRDAALEESVKAVGGDVKTGISKKVDYLVVGGIKGQGSAKEKKAIELGIPVLNVAEFKQMFGF